MLGLSDASRFFLLALATVVFLGAVEPIDLLHVGVVDDLGDIELAQHFLFLLLEGLLHQLVIAVLNTPLLVDLLNCA